MLPARSGGARIGIAPVRAVIHGTHPQRTAHSQHCPLAHVYSSKSLHTGPRGMNTVLLSRQL